MRKMPLKDVFSLPPDTCLKMTKTVGTQTELHLLKDLMFHDHLISLYRKDDLYFLSVSDIVDPPSEVNCSGEVLYSDRDESDEDSVNFYDEVLDTEDQESNHEAALQSFESPSFSSRSPVHMPYSEMGQFPEKRKLSRTSHSHSERELLWKNSKVVDLKENYEDQIQNEKWRSKSVVDTTIGSARKDSDNKSDHKQYNIGYEDYKTEQKYRGVLENTYSKKQHTRNDGNDVKVQGSKLALQWREVKKTLSSKLSLSVRS